MLFGFFGIVDGLRLCKWSNWWRQVAPQRGSFNINNLDRMPVQDYQRIYEHHHLFHSTRSLGGSLGSNGIDARAGGRIAAWRGIHCIAPLGRMGGSSGNRTPFEVAGERKTPSDSPPALGSRGGGSFDGGGAGFAHGYGMSSPDRILVFDRDFLEDLMFWVSTNRKTALKVLELIESIRRNPFGGLGKPEPLRQLGEGVWSRRITQEHRLVYRVADDRVLFAQARYHY